MTFLCPFQRLFGTGYVHHFRESRNMEYFVNFFRNIRNIKNVFTNGFVTNETNPQKGRRNVNNLTEIKIEPNILMTLPETGHPPKQFLLYCRANASVKPSRKHAVQRVIYFQKIHESHSSMCTHRTLSLYQRLRPMQYDYQMHQPNVIVYRLHFFHIAKLH